MDEKYYTLIIAVKAKSLAEAEGIGIGMVSGDRDSYLLDVVDEDKEERE